MKHLTTIALLCISLWTQAQNYFQQEVKYNIDVRLDDVNHILHAYESVVYTNNSPQALDILYFHLWPNGYKNTQTAMSKQFVEGGSTKFYYTADKNRGYIDSLDFKVDGQTVKWEYDTENIDICKITLNTPVQSGASITITTPFKVKIPSDFSRLGHVGQQYQITQWYPKPAVFDRDGWHAIPYLNQGEFYSEYGSFDVSITLPKNYVVGATGQLQNADEVTWLNRKAHDAAMQLPEIPKDVASDAETKTLRYTQDNIHDFAWFADKRYVVLKSSVKLPKSGRLVQTWAMYRPEKHSVWEDATTYLNDALTYYSKWNGEYAYDHCTAVQGALSAGGAMEYPMITVVSSFPDKFHLEENIMHEVGHNWFYGMLGSNERDCPFLDEGINTSNQARYMETKYPDATLNNELGMPGALVKILKADKLAYFQFYILLYQLNASRNLDQPCTIHSADYTNTNYGAMLYMKSAASLNFLRHYLGDSIYDAAMQHYFDTWKFKHPKFSDFKKCIADATGQNLDWFFDEMLTTTKKLDYKVVRRKGDKLLVRNVGDVVAPFNIGGINNKQVEKTIWHQGFEGKKWVELPQGTFESYRIDPYHRSFDLNPNNNNIRKGVLFRRSDKVHLQLLTGISEANNRIIGCLPIVGVNANNGFMAGIALHNYVLTQSPVEWCIAPMWGFASESPAGSAHIAFNMPSDKLFYNTRLTLSGMQYAYKFVRNNPMDTVTQQGDFQRLGAEVEFHLRKSRLRAPYDQYVTLAAVAASDLSDVFGSYMKAQPKMHYYAQYRYVRKHPLQRTEAKARVEISPERFSRVWADVSVNFPYKKKGTGLDVRVFAGFNTTDSNLGGFTVGSFGGANDVLFEHSFFARTQTPAENFLARQIAKEQGGFALSDGLTYNGIVAINVSSSVINNRMLRLYANAAFANELFWETGVKIELMKNMIEVYVPMFASENIESGFLAQNVRFVLALEKLSPFKMYKSMFPY